MFCDFCLSNATLWTYKPPYKQTAEEAKCPQTDPNFKKVTVKKKKVKKKIETGIQNIITIWVWE